MLADGMVHLREHDSSGAPHVISSLLDWTCPGDEVEVDGGVPDSRYLIVHACMLRCKWPQERRSHNFRSQTRLQVARLPRDRFVLCAVLRQQWPNTTQRREQRAESREQRSRVLHTCTPRDGTACRRLGGRRSGRG